MFIVGYLIKTSSWFRNEENTHIIVAPSLFSSAVNRMFCTHLFMCPSYIFLSLIDNVIVCTFYIYVYLLDIIIITISM